MKKIVLISILLFFKLLLNAQVVIENSLPAELKSNSEFDFEVKITKGDIDINTRYQLDVPNGIVISEIDSKGGVFTFEENSAKIIWDNVISEREFTLKMKLTSKEMLGKVKFFHHFYYKQEDSSKVFDSQPFEILFTTAETVKIVENQTDSILKTQTVLEFEKKIENEVIATNKSKAPDLSSKSLAELIQQEDQLRKDAKEARIIGEKEKVGAEKKIAESNKISLESQAITDETNKQISLAKAKELNQKGENDKDIALKILDLAKLLESNADQIKALINSKGPQLLSKANNASLNNNSEPLTEGKANTEGKTNVKNKDDASKEVNDANKKKDKKPKKDKSNNKENDEVIDKHEETDVDFIYKVQIGAFNKKPKKSSFKEVGKVKIVKEDDKYKVLIGSFKTKEEAVVKRNEIVNKGVFGFIVKYKKGKRVK